MKKLKKLLILLIVESLLIGGFGVLSMPMDKISIKTSTITFSQPTISKIGEYITIDIVEANTYLMEKDKPILPSYSKIFVFPFKTVIKSVTCKPIDIETMKITGYIKKSPEPQILDQTISTSQQKSIDYGIEMYPLNWYSYDIGCGLYNNERSVI